MLTNEIQNMFNGKPIGPHELSKYNETGLDFVKKVNKLNARLVLDLGCGNNIYKGRIHNLIGIDILNNGLQDLYCDIIDLPFKDSSVDVVIAFGSINFGDENIIDSQLQEATRVLSPQGRFYFRAIPNHNHSIYYNWTKEMILEKTKKLNLNFLVEPTVIQKITRTDPEQEKLQKQHDARTGFRPSERIYCVWSKK